MQKVAQQKDNVNCGFHMIKNLVNYLTNNNPSVYESFDELKIKKEIKEDFKKVKIK
jgi:hypothetical protein